jgi:hypothetical protein
MTVATQLTIYNGACTAIGERTLQPASPGASYSSENRESRRALDDIWNRGGVRTCLAAGLWKFAGRGIQWNFDPDIAPTFGYQYAFQIPQDWVRWMLVATDPYFSQPLLQYTDEGSYFYCDLQMLWVQYVSDDPRFGMNLSAWPDNFQRYVEHYFGEAICIRITGDQKKREDVDKLRETYLRKAKSTNAMNESTAMIPPGQWRQSRHGRRQSLERGNRNSFYG